MTSQGIGRADATMRATEEDGGRDDSSNILALAERLRLRAHRASRAQYLAGKRAGKMHLFVGVPNTALTALVGTAIFASLGEDYGQSAVVIIGALTALAAVLAALQTFFGFGVESMKHRAAGARYGALKREVDVYVLQLRSENTEGVEAIASLSDFTSRFNGEEENAPDVPDRFYDQARREQTDDREGV